jgi:hypothetical protein
MDYLNYNGLKHYHKKILEGVKTDIENAQVDLTGYATEQWVENKGYLTEHQDVSGKVNTSDFEEQVANIQTISSKIPTQATADN